MFYKCSFRVSKTLSPEAAPMLFPMYTMPCELVLEKLGSHCKAHINLFC